MTKILAQTNINANISKNNQKNQKRPLKMKEKKKMKNLVQTKIKYVFSVTMIQNISSTQTFTKLLSVKKQRKIRNVNTDAVPFSTKWKKKEKLMTSYSTFKNGELSNLTMFICLVIIIIIMLILKCSFFIRNAWTSIF